MKIFLGELYAELSDKGLIKRVPHTHEFYFFNFNIRLSMVLPTLTYGPNSDNDYETTDLIALRYLAIVNIITSLEGYYENIFTRLSSDILTSELNRSHLKILRKNRFDLSEINKFESLFDYYKHESHRFTFQNKETIKSFSKLIGLDPMGNFHKEWEYTFGGIEDSTINIRHKFVHGGMPWDLSSNDENFIQERIKYALCLVHSMEEQIDPKYKLEALAKKDLIR